MLMEFAKFRQTVFCLEAFAFAAAQLWATHLRVVLGGIAMLIRDSHIRRLGCTCMYKRGPRCLCQYVGYCWVSVRSILFPVEDIKSRFSMLRYQFINVEDFEGRGESQPTPYFYQNLGEAEYCVALFMYMQLGQDTNLKIDSSE